MKLIKTFTNSKAGALVKVYKDNEWNEYVCRLFVRGEELLGSSYHTDDMQDAVDTAKYMLDYAECL